MTRAAIIVALLARTAAADRRVDLERCGAFEPLALDRAVAREMPAATAAFPFAVVVECRDRATAQLRVEPAPADGPIERTMDLGEVPGDLQLKLLAVAIAELYAVALTAPPPAPHVEPPPVVAVVDKPAAEIVASAPVVRPTTIALHAGVRFYTLAPSPLADIGGEITTHGLRVGVRGAIGAVTDPLGTIQPWLVTATGARPLVCGGSLCALARVEGGVAGAAVTAAPGAIGHSIVEPYGEVSLAGELSLHLADASELVMIEAGWSAGYLARANGVVRAALAGPVAVASLGVRW